MHDIAGKIVDIRTRGDINTTRDGLIKTQALTLYADSLIPDESIRLPEEEETVKAEDAVRAASEADGSI